MSQQFHNEPASKKAGGAGQENPPRLLDRPCSTASNSEFAQVLGTNSGSVFVDLPEVGATLDKGTSFGSVESVKAVEDMYAPIAGEVVQRNESVLASPEELQNDPHGEGWLLLLRPSEAAQLENLMDAATYSAKVNAA